MASMASSIRQVMRPTAKVPKVPMRTQLLPGRHPSEKCLENASNYLQLLPYGPEKSSLYHGNTININ